MSWQNLIRDWLRRTAEQRVREAVAATGQGEQPGRSSFQGGKPLLRPAHFGLVAAEKREAVGLIDRLDGLLTIQAERATVYEGGLHGRRLAIIVCGTAPQDAAEAAEVLIDGHSPNWVISTGFCAGLLAELSVGDIVLADHVVSPEGVLPVLAPDGENWRIGKLLSMQGITDDPADRPKLADQYGAIAIDAHSYAVAGVACKHNLTCAALCVVRQALEQQGSQDMDRLRRKQSLAGRAGLLTALLWNRPRSLKTLWNEKEQDLVCADRLADGLAALMDSLAGGSAKEGK